MSKSFTKRPASGPKRSKGRHARRRLGHGLLAGLTCVAVSGFPTLVREAWAQTGMIETGPVFDRKKPVTFQADRIEYNQKTNVVTLAGHVEAWQAGHVLFADRVLYDRNTNVADAVGHVVLVSPDGQIIYSDYAELSRDMSSGIMSMMNVTLAQNAKLAANGGRRTDGKVNELSRAVYTACSVCAKHPNSYPLWQISARSATQDIQHHLIEYRDATMQIDGVPILWLPYFSHPDPSAKRMSGLLIPAAGFNSHLGAFTEIPYYWVINNSTDATVTPILSTKFGLAGDAKYREDFNFGRLNVDASAGLDHGKLGGALFANGIFDLNPSWRAGFNVQRASSVNYLNDYSILPNANELQSEFYLEGFGAGSYARLESSFYQGLVGSVTDSQLPLVLPYGLYSYKGQPDSLGGTLSLDANAFNILRTTGTSTQRAAISGNYALPFHDGLGELWSTVFHVDAAAYAATGLNDYPNYDTANSSASELRALPQVALNYRWPIVNDSGALGSQLVQPIVQLIAAPIISNNIDKTNIPNEDSYDFQFTDANLFGFNKYPGIDRMESGMRANLGLESEWFLNNGGTIDGLIGQSYRAHKDNTFAPGSGLDGNVSDIVARLSYTPTSWLDFVYRTRLNHNGFQDQYTDTFVSAGVPALRVTGGYLYSKYDPYYYYDGNPPPASYYTPRNEVTFGLSTVYKQWNLNTSFQRNIQTGQFDSTAINGGWQNDCLGVNLSFIRSNTTIGNETGSTTFLLTVTFKTIGTVGFNAL
ncbi:MAG: LPS-assembly protein LptD [Proteobacteria bacterium]|nr:LPS-assembly protein LptD [Pseudomonadota bacterium]